MYLWTACHSRRSCGVHASGCRSTRRCRRSSRSGASCLRSCAGVGPPPGQRSSRRSPFTLWHGVIVTRTVALTNLQADPLLVIVGLAGAFAAVFVGGILFAALRLVTGQLAGSIVAHWAFNAALLVGLYAV